MRTQEDRIIALWREAIAHLETDHEVVRYAIQDANRLFADRLIRWSEPFARLEQEMYRIYCAYTPQPRGHYRTICIPMGYSSIETSVWVDDPVQPERPSVAQLLARFDEAITRYDREQGIARQLPLFEETGEQHA